MVTSKKSTSTKAKVKKADTFTPNTVCKALVKGRKHSDVANGDYVRLLTGEGKSYAQLAARRETAILENVPDDLKVTGLKLAGDPARGRWIVTEADIPKVQELLDAAQDLMLKTHAEHARQIKAKGADKSEAKPSGERARSRGSRSRVIA